MSHFVLIDNDAVRVYCNSKLVGRRSEPAVEKSTALLSTETADWVADTITSAGLRNEKWALGLPSSFVFFSNLRLERAIAQNPTAVAFALEEHLPIEAEQMISCVGGSETTTRIATLDYSRIEEFVGRLYHEHDLVFESVTAISLVIADYLHSKKFSSDVSNSPAGQEKSTSSVFGSFTILTHSGSTPTEKELFVFRDGQINQWSYSINSPAGASIQWPPETPVVLRDARSNSSPQDSVITRLPMPDRTSATGKERFRFADHEMLPSVFESVSSGALETPFDFSEKIGQRIGANRSKTDVWEICAVAVLLSLVILSSALSYRSTQWDRVAIELDQSNRQAFKQLFPQKRINGPIAKILDSELKRRTVENDLVVFSNQTSDIAWNAHTLFTTLKSVPQLQVQNVSLLSDGAVVRGSVDTLARLDKLKLVLKQAGYEIGVGSSYALNFELLLERAPEDLGLASAESNRGAK